MSDIHINEHHAAKNGDQSEMNGPQSITVESEHRRSVDRPNNSRASIDIDGSKHFAPANADVENAMVLVEGPGIDSEFTVQFLRAAMDCNSALNEYYRHHPDFRQRIKRLELHSDVEFSWAAMEFVRRWLKHRNAFLIKMTSGLAEMFVIMVGLGFFKRTQFRYQMVVPTIVDGDLVAAKLLRLAETEDSECRLYPETLVSHVSRKGTVAMKRRLRYMDYSERIAKRDALLAPIERD